MLLLCPVVSPADEAEVAARTKWGEARLAIEKKDTKAALQKFEEALQALPSDPLLLYEAACCAYELGDLEKAETWIGLAVRSEDPAFRQRADYQDTFTLAARVRAARQLRIETAEYEQPVKLMEEAVRATPSIDSFVAARFEAYGKDKDKWRLTKASAGPELSGEAHMLRFPKSCSIVLGEIADERKAKAVAERIAEVASKELPRWEELASKDDARMLVDEESPKHVFYRAYYLRFPGEEVDDRIVCCIDVESYTPPRQKAARFRVTVYALGY